MKSKSLVIWFLAGLLVAFCMGACACDRSSSNVPEVPPVITPEKPQEPEKPPEPQDPEPPLHPFAAGDGTQASPYAIATYAQLCAMRAYPQSYYILTADIDMRTQTHMPIFDDTQPFGGQLDGDGHTVYAPQIVDTTAYPSLLGKIEGGTVRRLRIEDAAIHITGGRAGVTSGILAGYASGTVTDVTVTGEISVTGDSASPYTIGGLLGKAYGRISDCHVKANIQIRDGANGGYFGGLLGDGYVSAIERSTVECTFTAEDIGSGIYFGGLAARAECAGEEVYIADCRAELCVNAPFANVAGLLGNVSVAGLRIIGSSVTGDLHASEVVGFCDITRASSISVESGEVRSNIISEQAAVGFLKSASRLQDVHLTHCHVESDIAGATIYGIGKEFLHSDFFGCYVRGTWNATGSVYGFVQTLTDSVVSCSYSEGQWTAGSHGTGFVLSATSDTRIENCYSVVDLTIYDERDHTNSAWRTLATGFATNVSESAVNNCYFAGSLFVTVLFEGGTNTGDIKALFVGNVRNSQIVNCHVLRATTSNFSAVHTADDTSSVQYISYDAIGKMYDLADKLNAGSSTPIWTNRPDAPPLPREDNKY